MPEHTLRLSGNFSNFYNFRSSNLDNKWTYEQLKYMQLGGNGKARAHFTKSGIENYKFDQKYNSQAARTYKKSLKEAVEKELSRETVMGEILDSVGENEGPLSDEPNSAPPRLMTKEEKDDEWNFMDAVKKSVDKKDKFNIVLSEEKEKIVIKERKLSPRKAPKEGSVKLGDQNELKRLSAPYKSVVKNDDVVDWDEWKEGDKNVEGGDEEAPEVDHEWNSDWGSSNKNQKFTPIPTQKGSSDKQIMNKAKFMGLGSQDNGDKDKMQREILKRKNRELNAPFLELNNEAKIEYIKDTAKELGQKTAEYSGVVYEKVTEVGEQVGEALGKWWNGVMQQ